MCGTLSWPASRKRKLATNLRKSSTKRLNGLTHTEKGKGSGCEGKWMGKTGFWVTMSHELSINLPAANHHHSVALCPTASETQKISGIRRKTAFRAKTKPQLFGAAGLANENI